MENRYTGFMTTQTTPPQKQALILGGGGSRGSYTMGVVAALHENQYHYDLVTGISIGAFVGGAYAMHKEVDYSTIIDSFTDQSVASGLFQFPNRNSVLKDNPQTFNQFIQEFQQGGPNINPLRESYSKIFDFEAFKNSSIDYICLAANLTQNKPAYFHKADFQTKDEAINAMLASAAYFPAFSFMEINGDYYADGGYLNSQLGRAAVDLGYTNLTVVPLVDPGAPVNYCKEQTTLLIRPILKLDYYLNFNKDQLVRQIEQGHLEALKYMNLAVGYVYTFYKEDAFLFKVLSKTAVSILKKNDISLTNEMLIDGIAELLGYRPGDLNVPYMENYQVGLLLECLALIAGITPYKQYHLLPFVKDLLDRLENFSVNITPQETGETLKMDRYGALNLLAFFHHALAENDGKLPVECEIVKNKFTSLYYLGLAWHILDKFSLVINLF